MPYIPALKGEVLRHHRQLGLNDYTASPMAQAFRQWGSATVNEQKGPFAAPNPLSPAYSQFLLAYNFRPDSVKREGDRAIKKCKFCGNPACGQRRSACGSQQKVGVVPK